jgi:hypothetical protein
MNAQVIRRAMRALLPSGRGERKSLVVQHLGFESAQLDTLPAVLDDVGRELGVELTLDGVGGDVVLAEQAFVARVTPQVLHAFLEERPLLTVAHADAGPAETWRQARLLHQELVRQLRSVTRGFDTGPEPGALAGASTLPPASGFDSSFDTRQHTERHVEPELDPDRAELLNRLRRGLADSTQAVLAAGYGRLAALSIDFKAGVALVDELAEQRLRIAREVPYLAQGARPGARARTRDLDRVVWDIALAAGDFRLLHSPVNWWHTPLSVSTGLDVSRYTPSPQHRELARCLAAGPVSAAELRRRCRVSVSDLRGFLQAGLFLGLIHWLPTRPD